MNSINHGTGTRRADPKLAGTLTDSVLRLIWRENRISRADIAKKIGLSRSTVTEIIKELLLTGLIAEVGDGKSTGGRKPIVLEFQYGARCILGVDVGATHITVLLTDLQGKPLVWRERKHNVVDDPEGTRKIIYEFCDECLSITEHDSTTLLSIGVAVPSPVETGKPDLLSEIVIPAWHGKSDLNLLKDRYNVPVYIDNDANLGALAAFWWGAGKGTNDLVYIKIGHGIGAGYIFRGELYRGGKGLAGEFGHMPIDIYGEECVCGLRGCLTTLVGEHALINRYKVLLGTQPHGYDIDQKINLVDLIDAAMRGELAATRVIQEAADYLGVAISGLSNIINPDKIIIGGSLARVGDLLLKPVQEKVKKTVLVQTEDPVVITMSSLGPDAVVFGAATLALEEAFAKTSFLSNQSHNSEFSSFNPN
ncbi:MAG: ROK family protein [Melioribacteraceae bacterium]|nr:ROK family protein [Melioribacteraceae bacterium]MCF8265637.1 ROK family protein [Melioribacteraceae bacterium]